MSASDARRAAWAWRRYVEAARARGVRTRSIVYRYAFKNALIPVVTILGLQFAILFACATIGSVAGDLLSYLVGARMGESLLARPAFQKRKDLLRKAERFFYEHGGKSVFAGRFVGFLRGGRGIFGDLYNRDGHLFYGLYYAGGFFPHLVYGFLELDGGRV